jgi:hypothetical protein
MTDAPRVAFGAEFVGAPGFLDSATYGLPPGFLVEEMTRCLGQWQAGTLDVPTFDGSVRRGRAAYAALVGVPVDTVAMGGSLSSVLGLVAAAIPDGTRVATLTGDFTSTTFPFAAQAGRGVTLAELTADTRCETRNETGRPGITTRGRACRAVSRFSTNETVR